MYIPNTTYLEKGMLITYDDIKEAQLRLDEKVRERAGKLQHYIEKLTVEYGGSLRVPGDPWLTGKGLLSDFVKVGVRKNGVFEEMPLSMLSMDSLRDIHFSLCTVIDSGDVEGKALYVVDMSISMNDGKVCFCVAGHAKEITIWMPDSTGAFHEVCAVVKSIIMKGLKDPRLD
ncbi:hypothetical protein CKG00_18000 [Morganella morganii]|uniref:Uncharacterized protein n=1 Tax=Morganella morganii TaxID=582 RepID=A0A433ZQB6_MORMO|nr:hypothetical protein [Morganella morganii]RUT64259.1 hypothetical protein CKG00_18000 [Morganella morganii]